MSVEANKRLVRAFYEEVINIGDVSRLEDFVSPDYADLLDPFLAIGAVRVSD